MNAASAGGAVSFAVSGFPNPVTAGTAGTVSVRAVDANGVTVNGYTGTVQISSSDAQAVLPANYQFQTSDGGIKTFSVTLKTAGSQSITATDTVSPIYGSQTGIQVNTGAAGGAVIFAVSGFPSTVTAGTAGTVSVRAVDANGVTVNGYTGTVQITSSDVNAVLPANYAFVAGDNGVHQFGVTLKLAGLQSITATDTVTSSITGSQTGIQVNALTGVPAVSLVVSGFPNPVTAGTAGTVSVRSVDANGISVVYTGTVQITSSDVNAVLPANYAFVAGDNGVHQFGVTLKLAGLQSITATDTVTSSITGSQTGIQVNALTGVPAVSLVVSGFPNPVTAGTAGTVSVRSVDANGISVVYTGTVQITSSDVNAVLPANYAFVAGDNGVHQFGVTLKLAGLQSITATDTVTSSITGSQTGIQVNADVASKLAYAVGAGQSITVGDYSSTITVQLQDANGNPVNAGSSMTVNLASTATTGRFYNTAHSTRIYSVTINAGANSASFCYYDTATGTPTLTASYGTLTPAITQFSINNYQLVFTGGTSQNLAVGAMSGTITIERQTSGGSHYSTGAIDVTLITTSSGGAFYATSSSTTPITTLTINGQYQATFYYKDSTSGTPTLTVSSAGYASDTTTFTIAPAASKLAFIGGAGQTLVSGQISSLITIQRQDANSNPTTAGGSVRVNLQTSSISGIFYSDAAETTQITYVTIDSGSSTAPSFYYRDLVTSGTSILTASATGLTSATTQFTITSSAILNVGFEGNWMQSSWYRSNDYAHTGSWSMKSSDGKEGDLTSNNLNAVGATSITVDFWYRLDNTQSSSLVLNLYDGSSYHFIANLGGGTYGTWLHYTYTTTDTQYFKSNFRVQFFSTLNSGQNVWVDDVQIRITGTTTTLTDSFEIDDWGIGWSVLPNPPWFAATDQTHSGQVSAKSDPSTDGPFTCDPINAQGATSIQVSFWYMVHLTETSDLYCLYTGAPGVNNMIQLSPSLGGATPDVWHQQTFTITDPSAFTSNFKFRFYSTLSNSGGQTETVWVDDVTVFIIK